jgi:hypothetical protein
MEEKDIKNSPANIKNISRYFLSAADAEPHIQLFFYAIIIQLLGLSVSGFGYYISPNPFWLIGSFIYFLWFLIMLAALHPETDRFLYDKKISLKKGTTAIIAIMVVVIIGEIVLLILPIPASPDEENNPLEEAILAMQNSFNYTDSTALTIQAVENLLDGKNPYAHSNIVTALIKYGSSYNQTTPLRVGNVGRYLPLSTTKPWAEIWEAPCRDTSQVRKSWTRHG